MAKESGQQGNKAKLTSSAHYFPIIGIGASAGQFINGISV
jgi:hypothetical protein